jgi:protein SCO1/2
MRWLVVLMLVATVPCRAAPPDISGIEFDQHPGASVTLDAPFTDYTGRRVTLGSLLGGEPAVLLLGYFHCPSLCQVVRDDALNALAHTGLATPGDYRVLDISIDPREGPADAAAARMDALARYKTPGAETGWNFLTGDTTALAQAVGFRSRWDPDLRQFLHPTGMVVLTPAGTVSSYALGVGYPATDLRGALLRARDGAVAAAASPVLLLCFHFDPATGRYSLAILKLLRLAAALTVVTIAGMLLVLHRRGRGGRPA